MRRWSEDDTLNAVYWVLIGIAALVVVALAVAALAGALWTVALETKATYLRAAGWMAAALGTVTGAVIVAGVVGGAVWLLLGALAGVANEVQRHTRELEDLSIRLRVLENMSRQSAVLALAAGFGAPLINEACKATQFPSWVVAASTALLVFFASSSLERLAVGRRGVVSLVLRLVVALYIPVLGVVLYALLRGIDAQEILTRVSALSPAGIAGVIAFIIGVGAAFGIAFGALLEDPNTPVP